MQQHYEYAVIGAGVSGLSAAYFLRKKSISSIALIDPAAEGGVIRTEKQGGFTLECGPNVLMMKPAISELISELGLENSVVLPAHRKYKQMVLHAGRPEVVPKSPPAFLKSRLLSLSEKLSVLRGLFKSAPIVESKEDLSVAEFFGALIGSGVTGKVVDPVLQGIYGGDVRALSARSIFPTLFSGVKKGQSIFGTLRSGGSKKKPEIAVLQGGMQLLTEKLWDTVSAGISRYRSAVSAISSGTGIYNITLADGTRITANAVVVSTAGKATAAFISGIDGELAGMLNQLPSSSLSVLHLSCSSLPSEYRKSFGVLLPSTLDTPFLGVMFNSELFPHLAPSGKQLLTVCLGGIHHPQFHNKDDRLIIDRVLEELRDRFLISNCEVLRLTRWNEVIPQYNVGHYRLVERFRQVEKEYPGLYFVGSDNAGVGVPDRISAVKTALMAA